MARGKRILIGLSLVVSGYLAVCWLLSGGYLGPQRTVPQRPAGLEDAMIGDTPGGAKSVVVGGVSMGGAAAWLATRQTPHIDGVFSEGAYARFGEAMDDTLNATIPGGSTVLRPVVWFARLRSAMDPSAIRPVDAAKAWRKPALIIQAGDDRLIRAAHANDLAEACASRVWTVEGAAHANCYLADTKAYDTRVSEFVRAARAGKG